MNTENITYLADLFDPEVIGAEVEKKLVNKLVMDSFVEVDLTLQGKPGDTVTLPSFRYIGDAEDVAEGEAIPVDKLVSTTRTATIKKIGKGVPVTDEAILSGYGDPIAEATKQLALALKQKWDNDIRTMLLSDVGAGMSVGGNTTALDDELISAALVKFGEEIDGQLVMPISPEQLKDLRDNAYFVPASEISADIRVSGSLGSIHGVQFIIRNKLVSTEAGVYVNYIIKEKPIKDYVKRGLFVETVRDAEKQTTTIYASQIGKSFLYDESKVVKVTSKGTPRLSA